MISQRVDHIDRCPSNRTAVKFVCRLIACALVVRNSFVRNSFAGNSVSGFAYKTSCRSTCLLVILASLLSSCADSQPVEWTFNGTAMGTTWQATLVLPKAASKDNSPGINLATTRVPPNQLQRQIQSAIEQLLDSINQLMSTYEPTSALSRFNATQSTDWIDQPAPVIALLRSAAAVSEKTQGAYDVTLGGLVNLWGFGSDRDYDASQTVLPDQVTQALDQVGFRLLQYSADDRQVRKQVASLQVDLSSIAKGYTVDRVGDMLEDMGIDRYLFELGGEIRTRGLSAEDSAWVIALESPQLSGVESGLQAINAIAVHNAHIATSGDYRNYRELDGRRISHLIDGRTGYPVTNRLASVTVLHSSTELADVWATAFMLIGADAALTMADDADLAVSLTLREEGGFTTRNSRAFEAYLLDNERSRLSFTARLKRLFGS